jgi:hypothetical protein
MDPANQPTEADAIEPEAIEPDPTDADPTEPDPTAETNWGFDAAIGAAAIVVKVASETSDVITDSVPGRAASSVARRMVAPLTQQGAEVRDRLTDDATPVAKRIVEQATPEVLEVVDINEILRYIDIDAIIDRVDIDAIISRVDINAIISRVDINEIVERVDIESIMQNTELGGIIAKSTSGFASEILDVVRANGVSLDNFVARLVNRILRRRVDELPSGPVLLVEPPPPANRQLESADGR